jgi:hypothetical protein
MRTSRGRGPLLVGYLQAIPKLDVVDGAQQAQSLADRMELQLSQVVVAEVAEGMAVDARLIAWYGSVSGATASVGGEQKSACASNPRWSRKAQTASWSQSSRARRETPECVDLGEGGLSMAGAEDERHCDARVWSVGHGTKGGVNAGEFQKLIPEEA